VLPDDVLLKIFDLSGMDYKYSLQFAWKWYFLVHVCQRWRQIVFASPHRLNLRILCTYRTHVRKNLDIWPAFPIIVDYGDLKSIVPYDEDDLLAALEHPDRVCSVNLRTTPPQLEQMVRIMQEPFPVLTDLNIILYDAENFPALPPDFLGGSTPSLQSIHLCGIPFPALPRLLVSASNLFFLTVDNLTRTGYFSPQAMVIGLAVLPRLEFLTIGFQTAIFEPDQIHLPPEPRIILPSLTHFRFRGTSAYLEDLVAQIDTPSLNRIHIHYFTQFVDFQVEQLFKFFDCSVRRGTLRSHSRVTFSRGQLSFDKYHHGNSAWESFPAYIILRDKNWEVSVSQIIQVVNQFSAICSNMVHLKLLLEYRELRVTGDAGLLQLLHQCSAVQTLHISRKLAGHIALVLESITADMVDVVLPSLELISLEDQPSSSIEKFDAARRVTGHPITVVHSEEEFDKRLKAYFSN
jgi:hypothetical protein